MASAPEVLLKINSVLDDDEHNVGDLARLFKYDAALSAKLLKVVNSPFYGMPRTIISIDQAIQILGTQELANLVITAVVVDRFSKLPNAMLSMRQFWQGSVRCALWARELASLTSTGTARDHSAIFLCGLLLDIGRLIVYRHLPEAARAACLRAQAEKITEQEAVKALLGFSYHEVGAELCRQWRLPELLAVTQEYCSNPLDAPTYIRETMIVALAGYCAGTIAQLPPEGLDAMAFLGLDGAALEAVRPEVDKQFDDAMHLYCSQ